MAKHKRHRMDEALKRSSSVQAFLCEGSSQLTDQTTPSFSEPSNHTGETRIAVTIRLPESLVHALIDASAERRKRREKMSSQQDIVAEALAAWLDR